MQDRGEDLINSKLDIVAFIQHQVYLDKLVRLLLSPTERFLIKNNKRFVLDSDVDSSPELEDPESITSPHDDQFLSLLMMDAFHHRKRNQEGTRLDIEFELSSFPVLEQTGNSVVPNHPQRKRVSAKLYLSNSLFLDGNVAPTARREGK